MVEASCSLATVGQFIFSVASFECTLKEDCKGGTRRVGDYSGSSGGFSFSPNPASYVKFTTNFSIDNMNSLTGTLDIVGFTIAGATLINNKIFSYGRSYGAVCLNNNCTGDISWSTVSGIDFGYDIFLNGFGRVTNIRKECCSGSD